MTRLALGILFCFASLSASAQVPQSALCAPHEKVVEDFKKLHGEYVIVRGLVNQLQMFELLWNSKTKTWTAIVTTPRGQACLVGTGTALNLLPIQSSDPA
tara:strand:- start:626 stop:925 length:300 start_codon:yes stop_codon:yes gene_type:complete